MVISTLEPATEERIIALISFYLKIPSSHINPYTHFQDDLHLDELDRMLLIAKLESQFNAFLTNEEAAALQTVRDASLFLTKYAASAA